MNLTSTEELLVVCVTAHDGPDEFAEHGLCGQSQGEDCDLDADDAGRSSALLHPGWAGAGSRHLHHQGGEGIQSRGGGPQAWRSGGPIGHRQEAMASEVDP